MIAPVIGFDLDLTLVDSRPGIAATLRAVSARTGRYIDVDAAVVRLAIPLDEELAKWFPAQEISPTADLFRSLYKDHGVAVSPALPGVADSLAAIRARGGRIIVVTAKYALNAQRHLDHLGLVCDSLTGWAYGPAKATVLKEHGAHAYVGDHPLDMAAAKAAGAVAIGVETGGFSTAELTVAGADLVLPDLTGFPAWLKDFSPA
jgi:phosphoglycolate phosphatase